MICSNFPHQFYKEYIESPGIVTKKLSMIPTRQWATIKFRRPVVVLV